MSNERISPAEEAARLVAEILNVVGVNLPALAESYRAAVEAAEGNVVVSPEMEGILGLINEGTQRAGLMAGQTQEAGLRPGDALQPIDVRAEVERPTVSIRDWVDGGTFCTQWVPSRELYLRINHLLNLASMREFMRDQRFGLDTDLVRSLQSTVEHVATRGKPSARVIPLPSQQAIREGWQYAKGSVYRGWIDAPFCDAATMTIAFHSSPELVRLTVIYSVEFHPSIFEVKADAANKRYVVSHDRDKIGNDNSIAPDLVSPYRGSKTLAKFELSHFNLHNPDQWGVKFVLVPDGRLVLEVMVRYMSDSSDKRTVVTPFTVVLGADETAVQEFIGQFGNTWEKGEGDEEFGKKLLYYLVSTLYFGGDPQMLYLCGRVSPHSLSASLPHDLEYFPLANSSLEPLAPVLRRWEQVLEGANPDDLSVVERLCGIDLGWVADELRDVFPDADWLFQQLYDRMVKLAQEAKEYRGV